MILLNTVDKQNCIIHDNHHNYILYHTGEDVTIPNCSLLNTSTGNLKSKSFILD